MTQRSPGESSSPSPVLLLPVGTLDIFVWGGVSGDQIFVRLVLFCFDFRVSAAVYFYLCMLVYIFA